MYFSKARREYYLGLADRYRLETGNATCSIQEVYEWARARGDLEYSPEEIRKMHLAGFLDALSSDHAKYRGKKVRRRLCATYAVSDGNGRQVQKTIWAIVEEANDDFLHVAMDQLHAGVADDVESIKVQQEYVNSFLQRRGARLVNLDFDFNDRMSQAGD